MNSLDARMRLYVDYSRTSDAGEAYLTQTFRSGRLPIVRALFYLYPDTHYQ